MAEPIFIFLGPSQDFSLALKNLIRPVFSPSGGSMGRQLAGDGVALSP